MQNFLLKFNKYLKYAFNHFEIKSERMASLNPREGSLTVQAKQFCLQKNVEVFIFENA